MVPYVIPGSVVGIALVSAFNKKPFVLVGTFLIMVISLIIRRNAYTIRKFCSDYAIEHVIPRSFGEIPVKMRYKSMYVNNIKSLSDIMFKYPERSKRIVFTTANGYKPQYEYKFRHINYEKAVRMMMFFKPKIIIEKCYYFTLKARYIVFFVLKLYQIYF